MQFRQTIHPGWSAGTVFIARCVVRFFAKHIVGADVYKQAINALHAICENLWSVGIQFLGNVEIVFGCVYVCIRCAIYDYVNFVQFHEIGNCI